MNQVVKSCFGRELSYEDFTQLTEGGVRRELLRQFHPDKNAGTENSIYTTLNNFFEVLSAYLPIEENEFKELKNSANPVSDPTVNYGNLMLLTSGLIIVLAASAVSKMVQKIALVSDNTLQSIFQQPGLRHIVEWLQDMVLVNLKGKVFLGDPTSLEEMKNVANGISLSREGREPLVASAVDNYAKASPFPQLVQKESMKQELQRIVSGQGNAFERTQSSLLSHFFSALRDNISKSERVVLRNAIAGVTKATAVDFLVKLFAYSALRYYASSMRFGDNGVGLQESVLTTASMLLPMAVFSALNNATRMVYHQSLSLHHLIQEKYGRAFVNGEIVAPDHEPSIPSRSAYSSTLFDPRIVLDIGAKAIGLPINSDLLRAFSIYSSAGEVAEGAKKYVDHSHEGKELIAKSKINLEILLGLTCMVAILPAFLSQIDSGRSQDSAVYPLISKDNFELINQIIIAGMVLVMGFGFGQLVNGINSLRATPIPNPAAVNVGNNLVVDNDPTQSR